MASSTGRACVMALGAGLWALAWGCATPAKPPELEAFEKLRADPAAAVAAKKNPDLVNSADRWLARSREDWQDSDIDESVHAALMGQIKLKQAIALSEQDRAMARMATAERGMVQANEEHARVEKELGSLREQVALLEKLQAQESERRKLEEELTAEKRQLDVARQRAEATAKINDAELAIRSAETLNAPKHALAQFQAAKDLLGRAHQELQQSNFQGSQISAEMAKKRAQEAEASARPLYQQEAESAENRARAEALARDAAGLPGVVVRRDTRGSLQRLVLPLPSADLFGRRGTTIVPGREALLDEIAALIKKYPSYPVQLIGYTDSRGRTAELLALSMARAQSVYSALILRGVDPRRMVVSGQGSAEPVSDNRTTSGRAQNNRVEIIFLYQ